MKQPEYLVLNPIFNKFKITPITEIYVDEPYLNYFNEIEWRKVKKICHKQISYEIKNNTTIDSYKLNLKN